MPAPAQGLDDRALEPPTTNHQPKVFDHATITGLGFASSVAFGALIGLTLNQLRTKTTGRAPTDNIAAPFTVEAP